MQYPHGDTDRKKGELIADGLPHDVRAKFFTQNPPTGCDWEFWPKGGTMKVKHGPAAESKRRTISAKTAATTVALALLFFAFNAAAQPQPLIGYLAATTVSPATTNASAGNGTFSLGGLNKVSVLQTTVGSQTNDAAGEFILTLDGTLNGTDWVSDTKTITMTLNGSSDVTQIDLVTNDCGFQQFRWGDLRNTNDVSTTTVRRVHVFVPDQ